MILAQGKYWRAQVRKGSEGVELQVLKDSLPAELEELKDLRIEVPLKEWHRVVKHLRGDRKLLGGILLDFARSKDTLSAAIASDRLYAALQELGVEATTGLVEAGRLRLAPVEEES
jgi:hypothetical protein